MWTAGQNDEIDFSVEIEELEDCTEQPKETGILVDSFVARCEMIEMILDETEKMTYAAMMELITNTFEDTVLDVLQVRHVSKGGDQSGGIAISL